MKMKLIKNEYKTKDTLFKNAETKIINESLVIGTVYECIYVPNGYCCVEKIHVFDHNNQKWTTIYHKDDGSYDVNFLFELFAPI